MVSGEEGSAALVVHATTGAVRLGEVGVRQDGVAPRLADRGLLGATLVRVVVHGDVEAVVGEPAPDGGADALRGSRDEGRAQPSTKALKPA